MLQRNNAKAVNGNNQQMTSHCSCRHQHQSIFSTKLNENYN